MCLLPLKASLNPAGGRPLLDPEGELKLPCGKCDECISRRASDWATRAKHEISEHTQNCFLTLTYNEENLSSKETVKSDFQKFFKKLRKKLKIPKNPYNYRTEYRNWLEHQTEHGLKYMVSYEYGTQYYRPHMHAIIFNYSPPDQEYLRDSPAGYPLYISNEIEDLWGKGYHSIAEANEKTAYYIASYALKGKERTVLDKETGEYLELCDTMDVSKLPAIGLNFLINNADQIVNTNDCLPRYYQKKIEQYYPDLFQQLQDKQMQAIKNRSDHEKFAKFTIINQKSSLHSTAFRENCSSTQGNCRKTKEQDFLEQQLKYKRDDYVAITKGKT
jgi:hypothetical protein